MYIVIDPKYEGDTVNPADTNQLMEDVEDVINGDKAFNHLTTLDTAVVTNLNADMIDGAHKSTDVTFATGSDNLIPTELATKTYIDTYFNSRDIIRYIGSLDCSFEPNYPAADAGHLWVIVGTGRIGGSAGKEVEVDDTVLCMVDGSASGDEAAVGHNWVVNQGNIIGAVTNTSTGTINNIAVFDTSSGKVIKNSLLATTPSGTLLIPTGQTYQVGTSELRDIFFPYADATGGVNIYEITVSDEIVSYYDGLKIAFKANQGNTGSVVVNVNNIGVTPLYKKEAIPLVIGDIATNQIVEMIFDGTNFQLTTVGGVSTDHTPNASEIPFWLNSYTLTSSTGFTWDQITKILRIGDINGILRSSTGLVIPSKLNITEPADTATLTIANNKTLTVNNTLTLDSTDGVTATFTSTGSVAYKGNTLSQFAATTSLQLKNLISDETGSDSLVFANTPTLVSPILGSATATTINGNTLTTGTGTLTLGSYTLTVTSTGSIKGTNTGDVTLATNHGLSLTNQVIGMGAPSSVTGISTNAVTTTTHSHAASNLVNANLSGSAGITNANLANSSVTIGTTGIALGATSLTLSGLTTTSTGDATITALNRNFVTYGTDTKLFTGVPYDERAKFKIAVTYSAPNVNVSLSFTGANTSFSYYINGKKYTITDLTPFTNKTALAAEGAWFVYISYLNVFTVTQTAWLIYNPDVLLWNFYFNATDTSITWIGEERHTAGRDIFQHARNHTQGAIYKSGFTFSQYNGLTTYSSNTDNNFGRAMAQFTGGSFWDEDILNSIAHTDASITSTTTAPDTDWNLTVNQFLGFTALATAGTSATSIVFAGSHTLSTGQAVTVMNGNTTTVRGTTTITTGGTGTTFTVTSVTGLASGDAIVVSGRIPVYYISSVAPYVWRRLQATSFLGVTTQAATWAKSSTTVTGTFTNHGLQTGDIIAVTVSSDLTAIPLNNYTVTRTGANTFTFTDTAGGGASGTLTYNNNYNAVTIPNGVAQFNNAAAGGFSAMTANRYYPMYIAATNMTSEPLIAILGQGQSTNSTLATALGETPFQFQNLLGLAQLNIQEITPIYRLTYMYNTGGAFTTTRIKLYDSTFINLRVSTVTGTINNPVVSTLPANAITVDASAFSNNLTTADTNVQLTLNRLDGNMSPIAAALIFG